MGHTRSQRTLARPITYSGIGLHSGEVVSLTFNPADEDTGVVFRRTDMPGQPTISAIVTNVRDTARSTSLVEGEARVHTVEHVLAALRAYDIDNVIIDLNGVEPPVGNGSSDVFVGMIEESGVVEQDTTIQIRLVHQPVYWSEGDIHLVALPSDRFRVSYTLNYPANPVLQAQYRSMYITCESFKQELASCRSFGLYEEIGPLLDRGLIKGCSLANSVVVMDKTVFSKNGLFFPDEMVRHKILDLVGDLSLVGFPFSAHIIAIRSGHTSHKAFAQLLQNALTMENS